MSLPRAEWACEKVRCFAAPSREKATLVAIAGYCRPDGSGAWCSIDRLARDTGASRRTLQRHIKALELRGDLIVDRSLKGRYRTSRYYIPCCSLTIAELELLTGISGHQMELVLAADQKRSDVTIGELWTAIGVVAKDRSVERHLSGESASGWHGKGVTVTPQGCHPVTQTLDYHDNNNCSGVIQSEKYESTREITVPALSRSPREIVAEYNPDLARKLYPELFELEDTGGEAIGDPGEALL